MRIDQYAFVPANGGLLAAGGELPHVEDDWDVETLQADLPPTRLLRIAAHVDAGPDHVLRLGTFEPVDAAGTPAGRIRVPEPLRPAFARCLAELDGAPVPERRPRGRSPAGTTWSRRGRIGSRGTERRRSR